MTTLGIDLGTSSVKAALVHADGTVLASARHGYAIVSPRTGWAETDPHAWLAAARDAVEDVSRASLARGLPRPTAVGFSGQMHGVVAVDAGLAPLRPAILWADSRSVDEAVRLARDLPAAELGRLGSPAVPGFAATTLAWLRKHEPDAVRRARWFLQPKDWLRAALGGAVATERSDASGTLLFDVVSGTWSEHALAAVGVDRSALPDVIASTAGGGVLTLPGFGELAAVVGGADTACVVAGLGLRDGDAMIAVGTGAQVAMATSAPTPDASMRTHLFARVGDATAGWYRLGAVQSAGLVLTRVLDWLDASEAEAEAALAEGLRADDPVFVPHLAGERTPFMDPTLTGSWHELRLSTDRSAILRSVLEAIVHGVALAADAVTAVEGEPSEPVLLAGGGSTGRAFGQLLSDAVGLPVVRADDADAAVIGAALLAAGGTSSPVRPSTREGIEPEPARAALLRDRREKMVQYVRAQEAP